MLGLKGMDSLDYTGSGIDISKLESMELPTELAGVGEPYLAGYGQLIGSSFSGLGGGGDLQRQSSGLESMQSIEHALPQVHPVQSNTNYAEVLEAAARDFRAQQQGEGAGGAGR